MKTLLNGLLFLILSSSITMNAQITKPSLSPKITKSTQVGLATVSWEYGQPNANGRTIFGALIPYNKLWRTGANASTKLSFDTNVQLAGHKVPAGKYALYSIPGATTWTIILHKNTELWGAGGYQEAEDFVRFEVPVTRLKDSKETLEIGFENFHANGADLFISWENTKVVIPVFLDSDALIYKEIDTKLNQAAGEIKAQTYFDAAQFYYFKGKDLEKAALWFDKAIELRPQAFWYLYYRAELAEATKDHGTAVALAQKALAMAKESPSGDYGYIAKCELLLKKLR